MKSSLPSFRDPSGRLLTVGERVIRVVYESGLSDLDRFLSSSIARKFIKAGRIVSTRTLDLDEVRSLQQDIRIEKFLIDTGIGDIVEHERIPFPSFPFEWPPEMLYAAARLTIDLSRELLKDKLGLKDATPYNVLFNGPNPVFIDILSFEERLPGDSVWLPYAQFLHTFLLPLLVNKHFSIPLDQIFITRRDGLELEDVYRLCNPLQRLISPFLALVSIPFWLSSKAEKSSEAIYEKKLLPDPEKALFILESILKSLERSLTRLKPKSGKESAWSKYMVEKKSYVADDFGAKHEFVKSAMDEFHPRSVLDVGCNTGHFSIIAAEREARVVAIDYDPVVVGEVWRQARAEKLDILPLVVNLTRPSPALGWRNKENPSFLDRARGSFDAVFMLAVIHHMLVSERIPLSEIITLASELTSDLLVIEYVDPADPMFRRLTRGRDDLFRDLTQAVFEEECSRHFKIVRSLPLDDAKRCLYLMRKT